MLCYNYTLCIALHNCTCLSIAPLLYIPCCPSLFCYAVLSLWTHLYYYWHSCYLLLSVYWRSLPPLPHTRMYPHCRCTHCASVGWCCWIWAWRMMLALVCLGLECHPAWRSWCCRMRMMTIPTYLGLAHPFDSCSPMHYPSIYSMGPSTTSMTHSPILCSLYHWAQIYYETIC